jgi:hypothetical protein
MASSCPSPLSPQTHGRPPAPSTAASRASTCRGRPSRLKTAVCHLPRPRRRVGPRLVVAASLASKPRSATCPVHGGEPRLVVAASLASKPRSATCPVHGGEPRLVVPPLSPQTRGRRPPTSANPTSAAKRPARSRWCGVTRPPACVCRRQTIFGTKPLSPHYHY